MNPFNKPFNDWTVNDFNEAKKITNPTKVKQIVTKHKVDDSELLQLEEFHAKDWAELNQNLKERFGTGNFRVFNNKRVNHRMIKICADHETIRIFDYLKYNYPEFEPTYFDFKKEKWPNRRAISTFVTIKCPL